MAVPGKKQKSNLILHEKLLNTKNPNFIQFVKVYLSLY